jgi:hypothetical protein
MTNALLRRWLCLVACVLVPAGAARADGDIVSISYELLPAFTGTEQTGGRIVVTVTNHSDQTLANVTLRLADAGIGRVTGPLQEHLELAAGETRKVDGEFLLAADVVRSSRPLDWVIVHDDAQGFARQMLVHGQALLDASTGVAAKPAL